METLKGHSPPEKKPEDTIIRVAKDLSHLFYINNNAQTGKLFREKYLIPALQKRNGKKVIVDLRGIPDYDPDFLEEAFEGLVSRAGFSASELLNVMQLKCDSEQLTDEIKKYILDWDMRNSGI